MMMMTSQTFLVVFFSFIHSFQLQWIPFNFLTKKGFKDPYSLLLFSLLYFFPSLSGEQRILIYLIFGRGTISRHPHLNKTPREREGNALFRSFSFLLSSSTCPFSKMSFDFRSRGLSLSNSLNLLFSKKSLSAKRNVQQIRAQGRKGTNTEVY